MSAYLIFRFEITDPEPYGRYVSQVGPILISRGAQALVVNGDGWVLEGPPPGMTVVIQFASEEEAMAFYDSAEYAPLSELRHSCTRNGSCILAPGFVMPTG